jgi:hypothetical protein
VKLFLDSHEGAQNREYCQCATSNSGLCCPITSETLYQMSRSGEQPRDGLADTRPTATAPLSTALAQAGKLTFMSEHDRLDAGAFVTVEQADHGPTYHGRASFHCADSVNQKR